MALSIVVNGGGTFSASMEEGPVSFTASLGAVPGPVGATGATGAAGAAGTNSVIAATAPITYDAGTQTVGINPNPTFDTVTITDASTNLFLSGAIRFSDDTVQSSAFIGYQELHELSDVSIADRANDDGLFYNSSAGIWQSRTIGEVLGFTPIALSSLSGVAPVSYNASTGAIGFDSSTFLLKAGNLSGLADATVARTNLGLGTAATSASSAFAAAVHTHTASAITDFSTAVGALIPAASTTVAGVVELATDAEAVAGLDATRAITPAGDLVARIQPRHHQALNTFTAAVSGTGTGASQNDFGQRVFGGLVSGSTALFRNGSNATFPTSVGNSPGVLDFSKPTAIAGLLNNNLMQAGVSFRYTIGKTSGDGVGDLARAGYGITCTGTGPLVLQVHNATILTSVTSSFTPTGNSCFDVVVTNNGAGNVTLFVNGASVATSSAGPSAATATTADFLQIEIINTATLTTQSIVGVSRPQYYQGR